VTEREYRDYSDTELHELKRDLEKFQRAKIREKHASVDPDDTRIAGEHSVRVGKLLAEIEHEFATRREERRNRRLSQDRAAGFHPYQFTIPDVRPLLPLDGSSAAPIAHLEAWVFHWAIGQLGNGLIVQRADGVRGLLTRMDGVRRA
jgi:hypothetical protein